MARKTKYTKALAAAICQQMAEGKSVREICSDPKMPAMTTVFRWLNDDEKEEFRQQYARACALRADFHFEEILEIADDARNDWMEVMTKEGEPTGEFALNNEAIRRSSLRIETRKWMLGKMAPKKYGPKVELDMDGPLNVIINK